LKGPQGSLIISLFGTEAPLKFRKKKESNVMENWKVQGERILSYIRFMFIKDGKCKGYPMT